MCSSDLRENNIRITGTTHQEKYLPVIDDQYVFMETFRAWGSLMAEVWSEVDGIKYSYADWAWWMPANANLVETNIK